MSLERIHDAVQSDSRLASFDRYPYTSSDFVEAVAEALADIEKHGAIFGICGTDLWRNQPPSVGIRFHAFLHQKCLCSKQTASGLAEAVCKTEGVV